MALRRLVLFPVLVGVVSVDPDGEPGQEMILRRGGDSVSLCVLCLVEEMKDGNLKTTDGFPHNTVIPTLFKNKKNEVVVQSEWVTLGN